MLYTITKSDKIDEYESQYGKFVVYSLTVTDEQGHEDRGRWVRKVESPPPRVDEQVSGHFEEDSRGGRKFRKDPAMPVAGAAGRSRTSAEALEWDKRKQLLISGTALINSAVNYHAMIGDKPSWSTVLDDAEEGFRRLLLLLTQLGPTDKTDQK